MMQSHKSLCITYKEKAAAQEGEDSKKTGTVADRRSAVQPIGAVAVVVPVEYARR
jgi:hypothetical protein